MLPPTHLRPRLKSESPMFIDNSNPFFSFPRTRCSIISSIRLFGIAMLVEYVLAMKVKEGKGNKKMKDEDKNSL